ncbi:ABC-F family ATP-binding cassette domain-containing protein [Bosea sp. (in: a-proteobacteria)]|uniref:ABC-F family ATP-binding cassette domain-containing protein n=1 Tax=Bosea sp. (in: a-proteobacteria) TaxID=1871050 RepID=UPI002734BAE6|nr:ABC-F family ATP-binding cassette domain-containing protein [Bosea sp. (in: a-proteobacteria)]MDP3409586.1 ABC-F family ATP-binding cassette domain-containing protein [Bosea sp. (in: a-proteobacteria)]
MLTINDITYRLGERLLLDHASASLPDGSRVGLVGRNGTGKTTLFRMITGDLSPEGGNISLPKGRRIGGVAQEAPGGPETLIEVVLAADTERAALLAESETATDPLRIAEIGTRLADIDAHSAPARAATVLHGLGFNEEAQQRPCSDFSGGWRMRVALAAVLFSQPDLLLLDEPTNYLDLEGTLWLYDYLERYPHTVLVVSHDRELLDTCVDHILHLDGGKLTIYRGGYTSFAKQRAEKQMQLSKAKEKQDAERKHLQAFVDRFKAKASKARQAQSRVKRLEKMGTIDTIVDRDVQPFSLPGPERPLAPPMIVLDNASAGYGDRTVLSKLNLTLLPDDRIALLGSNGNGKSTFCKLIGGRMAPLTGTMRSSSKLETAYFAQHQLDELRLEDTPVAHLRDLMPDAPEAKVRSKAAQIGFPAAKAETPVKNLSGGEKARLMLGLAAFGGPHLLILDEPTNHLDIDSRTALVNAINDYPGAVILVSHDRFLIESCADRLWIVGDGTVKNFDGDMEDYRSLVLGGAKAARREKAASDKASEAAASGGKAEERKGAAVKRVAQGPLRQKLNLAEAKIAKLTGLIEKVDGVLGNGSAFARDPDKARELSKQRAVLAKTLEAAEEEWLELSAELESA